MWRKRAFVLVNYSYKQIIDYVKLFQCMNYFIMFLSRSFFWQCMYALVCMLFYLFVEMSLRIFRRWFFFFPFFFSYYMSTITFIIGNLTTLLLTLWCSICRNGSIEAYLELIFNSIDSSSLVKLIDAIEAKTFSGINVVGIIVIEEGNIDLGKRTLLY